jgi:hypothetical protein
MDGHARFIAYVNNHLKLDWGNTDWQHKAWDLFIEIYDKYYCSKYHKKVVKCFKLLIDNMVWVDSEWTKPKKPLLIKCNFRRAWSTVLAHMVEFKMIKLTANMLHVINDPKMVQYFDGVIDCANTNKMWISGNAWPLFKEVLTGKDPKYIHKCIHTEILKYLRSNTIVDWNDIMDFCIEESAYSAIRIILIHLMPYERVNVSFLVLCRNWTQEDIDMAKEYWHVYNYNIIRDNIQNHPDCFKLLFTSPCNAGLRAKLNIAPGCHTKAAGQKRLNQLNLMK